MIDDAKALGPRRWLATLPCQLLLLLALVQWFAAELHQRIGATGERLWPGYALELRQEPAPPAPLEEPGAARPPADGPAPVADAALVDDLLGAAGDAPTDGPARVADAALVGDLLDAAEGDAGRPDAAVPTDGPATAADDALVAALLDDAGAPAPRIDLREEARARHAAALAAYDAAVARRTPIVRAFAAVDRGLYAARQALDDHTRHLFIVLIGLCAAVATATRKHIALRAPETRGEDRASQLAQLLANLALLGSVAWQWWLQSRVTLSGQTTNLMPLWVGVFGLMAAANLRNLLGPTPLADGPRAGALATFARIPLYCVMTAIAGLYFVLAEGYVAGLAVYLEKLSQYAQLYLQVGLYVWAGMLLKRTRIADLTFDLVRPWRLAPELLAALVVVASAVPTAYSGASGIFVIAAGAVIFRELRRAGARPSLAMAATAMSGSTGVVLSPCLLVLIIAYLDRRVGSDELFAWGYWVYLLSSTLFVAAVVLTRRARLTIAPAREAAPATLRALRPLVPYALLFAVVPLTTWLAFDDGLNTISAPVLLPVILLAVIVFEGRRQQRPARVAVEAATAETSVHIGALLLLMALSACLGGVIERAEVMTALPAEFGSTWLTMAALVVVLVVVGMVMDPYGAVILVAATVAEVAYRNGIDPVHFWMVVLVAFELGYLTPPVALNHLLARQVVGVAALAEARAAEAKEHGFWARHERLLLPLAVMAAALLLVAFGPLVWQAL